MLARRRATLRGMASAEWAKLQVHTARDLVASRLAPSPERDHSLTRLRRGAYVDKQELLAAGRDAPYLARVRAVAAMRDQPVFARESALAVHGIPYGLTPDSVFTIGDATTAKKKAGVTHAVATLDPADVTAIGDLLVCTPEYAIVDLARRREPLVAVAAIDWGMRLGLVSEAGLLGALERQGSRGRAAAEWAIAFADGRSGSVGESYSRVRLHQLGFMLPQQLQAHVVGRSGKDWWVDMQWDFGDRPLFGEFDGRVKYGELAAQSGRTGAEALAAEKAREDDIRFRGEMMRWIWDDMINARRFERLLLSHDVPRLRSARPGRLV